MIGFILIRIQMSFKYTFLLSIILTCCKSAENNQNTSNYWNEIKIKESNLNLPEKYLGLELTLNQLMADIETNNKVNLPTPDLNFQRFSIANSSTMSPELATKFPNVKSYRIVSEENENLGSIDINNGGFFAMVNLNNKTYFINPVTKKSNLYICYEKQYAIKELNNPFIDQVIKK